MNRRNCAQVIAEMLKLIPSDKVEFIKALEWNMEDASYKAPEENIQWERTADTLEKFIIPNPVEEWEFEILSIFMVKSVEELKERFK